MQLLAKLSLLFLPLVLHCGQASAEKIQLNSNNTVVLRGTIDGATTTQAALDIFKQVAKRGNKTYPIYLVLDSPGGSIEAGFMFIQLVKHVSNLHTVSIFAASMASAIMQQLPGDRLVTENGTLMFHKAYAGLEGTVESGSLETTLYYVKRRVLQLENGNAKRMNATLADYKSLIVNELWLDAEDSIKYRTADRQVDLVCSGELIAKQVVFSIYSIFGRAEYNFSGFPLFRAPLRSSGDDRIKYVYGAQAVIRK